MGVSMKTCLVHGSALSKYACGQTGRAFVSHVVCPVEGCTALDGPSCHRCEPCIHVKTYTIERPAGEPERPFAAPPDRAWDYHYFQCPWCSDVTREYQGNIDYMHAQEPRLRELARRLYA